MSSISTPHPPSPFPNFLNWSAAAFVVEFAAWRIAIDMQIEDLFALPSLGTVILLGVGFASMAEVQRIRGAGLLAGTALGLMLGIAIPP